MRTKEELLKLLNPEGRTNIWRYIPVSHTYNIRTPEGGNLKSPYVQLHAVYFDEKGDFQGFNAEVEPCTGDDLEGLKSAFKQGLEACNNPLITSEELNLIAS